MHSIISRPCFCLKGLWFVCPFWRQQNEFNIWPAGKMYHNLQSWKGPLKKLSDKRLQQAQNSACYMHVCSHFIQLTICIAINPEVRLYVLGSKIHQICKMSTSKQLTHNTGTTQAQQGITYSNLSSIWFSLNLFHVAHQTHTPVLDKDLLLHSAAPHSLVRLVQRHYGKISFIWTSWRLKGNIKDKL